MPKVYDNLSRDGSSAPIPSGNGILTADISGSPKLSPLAITTGVTTIAVPMNAAEMVIYSDVAVRIGEALALSSYFTIPATTAWVIPLAHSDNVYLRADSGTGTLQFYFVTA